MNDSTKERILIEGDFLMSHEFTIDQPAEDIWPHMLNLAGWMPTHKLVTVAGTPGKVGELVKVYGADSDVASFYLEAIKFVPCRNLILKMMPLSGDEVGLIESDADMYGDLLGYENFTLVKVGDSTKLLFQSTAVFRSSNRTQTDMDVWIADAAEGALDRWKTIYEPELRALVAGGKR